MGLTLFRNISAFIVSISILFWLAACGGTSDSTGNTQKLTGAQSGGVSLVLTDAASDEFSEVNFTFTKIELIGGESGPVSLYEGERTINLLDLTDFGQLLSVVDKVPTGTYSKIRLTLKKPDGIELIPAGGGEPIYPPLAGNGKMDLHPRKPFQVTAGEMLYLQLDIDAKKSLHIVETGKGKPEYVVRPVVFIDILSEQVSGKLVRVTGYAHSDYSSETGSFELCTYPRDGVVTPTAMTDELCVDVNANSASVFDIAGEPADVFTIKQDSPLSLVGFIDTSRVAENDASPIGLTAEVIEMGPPGTYFILNAVIDTAPVSETDTFTFDTTAALNIPAQLQPGARVFRRDGERLDYTAIQTGVQAGIDGTPASTDPAVMKTTLVVIDHQPPSLTDIVSGPIQSLNLTDSTMMVSDVMIVVSPETTVIKAGVEADTIISEPLSLEALMSDDDVVVYGQYNSEAQLVADVILKKI